MASSMARTPEEYIAEQPAERRETAAQVRDLVNRSLPPGYTEMMGFGMITWCVPLEMYPDTYNGQPLCYAGLAAQKNHFSLYLMGAYSDPKETKALEDGFRKAGKKLDMGKSCIRFRTAEDLPLDVIARSVAATPPEKLIAAAVNAHGASRKKKR